MSNAGEAGESTTSEHRHLLVIGGQRCGTTWFQNVLATHPQVRLPTTIRPEPKFFLTDDDHRRYDAIFSRGDGRWLVDKSTTYLERPDAAVRAAACVPGAAVVAIVREPSQRAHSNWRFSVANGIEHRSVEDSLTPEAELREWSGLSTSPYHYLRRGRYSELLEPWAAAFGPSLTVLQYERMVGPAGATYLADQCRRIGLVAPNDWPVLPPPANAVATDGPLPGHVLAMLGEYYAEPNAALTRYGVDVSLWR